MAADPRRLEVGEVGEGREHRIETFGPDGREGLRLGGQHALPLVLGLASRGGVANLPERLDDRRVVRPTAPPAQPFARVRALHGRQVGVPGHHDHTNGERDRVALEPRGEALPVPPLVGMSESVDDRLAQARTAREHRPDLAVRRQRARHAFRVRKATGHQPQASHRSLVGRDAARELRQDLAARAHHDRSHGGVEGELVATDRRGALRRIRGATDEAKERELVDGSKRVRPASHRIGERSGGHTRTEGVAQRLTGAEVRRERHRGEELRQPKRAGRRTGVRADHGRQR